MTRVSVKPNILADGSPPNAALVSHDAQAELPPPDELFPDEQLAVTGVLLEAQRAVAAAVGRLALDPAGLDQATADLLVRLAKSGCGVRGVEIGARCQMTATRVSRLLDRAEADGLVRRTPDPSDRRAQHVVLTDKGLETATRLAPLMSSVLDELLVGSLSADERDSLLELLGRLRDRAHQLLAEG